MLTTTQPKSLPKLQPQPSRVELPGGFRPENRESSPASKMAIVGGFLLSFIAFATALFISRSLILEKKARAFAEASQIQLQDQIDTLQQDKSQLDGQLTRLREQLSAESIESAKIKKEMDQAGVEVANARKKITTLEEQNSKLKAQIDQLENAVKKPVASPVSVLPAVSTPTVLSADASDLLSETASAPVVAASPAQSQTEAVAQDTVRIMTVNRKFNFVVLNLGLKDNLKMGDQLTVVRNGTVIAMIQVEKLYDRFAAATIVSESDKDKIEKGDQIRTAS